MAEVGKAEDIKVDQIPEIVGVGDGRIGYAFRTAGQSFNLSGIFGKNSAREPHEGKITRVYFRTEDNIYALNDQGQLIDFKKAAGQSHVQYLNTERLKNARVFVGEKFVFPPKIVNTLSPVTGKITEIVAVNSKARSPNEIASKTGGKKSSIVEDFQKGLRNLPSGI